MVLNSILWNNSSQNVLLISDPGNLYIAYSYIENGESSINVETGNLSFENGNIDINPLFNNQFKLTDLSPCIDSGVMNYTFTNNYNISITENFNGFGLDMGAIESDFIVLIGDVNGDSAINVVEL